MFQNCTSCKESGWELYNTVKVEAEGLRKTWSSISRNFRYGSVFPQKLSVGNMEIRMVGRGCRASSQREQAEEERVTAAAELDVRTEESSQFLCLQGA